MKKQTNIARINYLNKLIRHKLNRRGKGTIGQLSYNNFTKSCFVLNTNNFVLRSDTVSSEQQTNSESPPSPTVALRLLLPSLQLFLVLTEAPEQLAKSADDGAVAESACSVDVLPELSSMSHSSSLTSITSGLNIDFVVVILV